MYDLVAAVIHAQTILDQPLQCGNTSYIFYDVLDYEVGFISAKLKGYLHLILFFIVVARCVSQWVGITRMIAARNSDCIVRFHFFSSYAVLSALTGSESP